MAEAGVKTTDLPPVATLDTVQGNLNGSASKIPVDDLAAQLLVSGPLADQIAVTTPGFASRTEFEAATIGTEVESWSIIHPPIPSINSRVLEYIRDDANGTACVSANGVKGSPADWSSPQHFGAQSGGNDGPAFAAQEAWMAVAGGREVRLWGAYNVANTVTFAIKRTRVINAGGATTRITGSHLTGPVVHLRGANVTFNNIEVMAGAGRAAVSYHTMGCGILTGNFDWAAPVGAGMSMAFINVEDCRVEDQPGDGILIFGSAGYYHNNSVKNNKGHGIRADGGQLLGLTAASLGHVGWTHIINNNIHDNGGHGICVGDPTNNGGSPMYRFKIHNNDVGQNATDAAVRYTHHQHYWVGEGFETSLNSGGGPSGGFYVAGRGHNHVSNRVPGGTVGPIYEVGTIAGYSNQGIRMIETEINTPAAPLDPMVTIGATMTPANGIVVVQSNQENITNVVAIADRDKFLRIDYDGDVTHGGGLAVLDVPVTTSNGVESFTPVLSDGTNSDAVYSIQVGKSVRVGDMVTVQIDLQLTSLGSLSGNLLITGMPHGAVSNPLGVLLAGFGSDLSIPVGNSVAGYIQGSEIHLRLWGSATGTVGFTAANMTATGRVVINANYIAA